MEEKNSIQNRIRSNGNPEILPPDCSGTTILPLSLQDQLTFLVTSLSVNHCILFGGAALDLLIDPGARIRDYDIGILDKGNCLESCAKALKKNGFKIIDKKRDYTVGKIHRVTMIFARKGEILLDVNFMEDFGIVGQFDIESLIWRFPEMDFVDRYGALRAFHEKTIQPIRPFEDENPLLVLNRLILLCAKYQLRITEHPIHKKLLAQLQKTISKFDLLNNDNLGEINLKASHYSTLLKAILYSRDRIAFLRELFNCGVMANAIPELLSSLTELSAESIVQINNAQHKWEIIQSILKSVKAGNQKKILGRLKLIGMRSWDEQDQKMALWLNKYEADHSIVLGN